MVDIFVSGKKKVTSKVEPSFAAAQVNSAKGASQKGFNLKKPVEQKPGLGAKYVTVEERLKGERSKHQALSAFCILPRGVKFETQEVKEKIILLLRQHWFTQVGWLLTALAMVFLPAALRVVPVIDFLPANFQFMAIVIWYLIVIAFVYEKFISWYFHVFIVTDERVIDIDFYNLLYKEVSEAKIDNIEDVTYTQGGVGRAVFDFGDLAMQTAGGKREFTIASGPQPNRGVKILNELKLEEEHEKIMGRAR